MQAFVDITLVLLIASGICQLQARFIVVDNSNEGRTTVPQDADVNVQDFQLAENNIEEIDNSSFVRYTNMLKLNLDRNPLKIIGENTFTQNKLFWSFHCNECNIQRLPEKFGIFPKIKIMLLRKGIDSSITPTILRYPYFEAFTSLDYFILTHIPLKNADIIKLPSSIKFLTMANTEFTAFPKLPSSLYPVLTHINLYNNPQIKHIPDDVWGNISDALIVFRADGNGLSTVGDLTQKQNLKTIDISRNHLETVPDLLNMSLLIGLKIGRNSRMSCDSRMCWRRLWDRMRVPLVSSDDVQCRQPPALVGYKLSEVNPKVMGCMEDKRFASFFTGDYFNEVAANGTETIYKKDTNYDMIMEEILANSTTVYKRSRIECMITCVLDSDCRGAQFNDTKLPLEGNCIFLRRTDCKTVPCD